MTCCDRKQLGLSGLALDAFVELIRYTGRASPALTELCCAPLRLLLSDSACAARLTNAIPYKVNYAHRSTEVEFSAKPSSSSSSSMVSDAEAEFDNDFNGLRLLPLRLRPELVDPLRWQSLLRAVILRLEPVQKMRQSVPDIPEAAPTPAGPNAGRPNHALLVTGSCGYSGPPRKRPRRPNVDSLFLVTCDPRDRLEPLLEAAALLETRELHELGAGHKLAVLKALCDACYDTQRLSTLLESNAEERANRITANNKKVSHHS
jgi:hypothetical protein